MKKNTAQNLQLVSQDWHPADIMAALKKRGWTISALAREANVHRSTIWCALHKPYPKSERLIAAALDMNPEQIWPQRYAARNYHPVLRHAVNA
ncbi:MULTISPECIES: helix-turn-helix domain-containing protein [Eikenella]|jgi:Mu-like prophage fluMu DNA-binding protein ner|uniref:helix-turn-helix domain-containing protein n=1 Tax=Eikenella TaxID=538 RepID=UPI0009BFFC13|nr:MULTISPECIES: helix-turn-helix domain-containing protein [Eikenella]MDU4301668.1 helix-turn-helix domain-containing protein [Eikenella corrodens]